MHHEPGLKGSRALPVLRVMAVGVCDVMTTAICDVMTTTTVCDVKAAVCDVTCA